MTIAQTLLDTFRLDGRWSLPGKPIEEWIPGHLDFSPEEGIRLSTEAAFEKPKPGPVRPIDHEVIHGITRTAQNVTLIRCVGGMAGLNLSGEMMVLPGQYHALVMVIGEHLRSNADTKYRSMRVRYHNCEDFVGVTGLRFEQDASSTRMTYENREPVQAKLDKFKVEIGNHGSYSQTFFESAVMREQGAVDASLDEGEAHLDEFLTAPFAAIHYLIQLAVGRRIPMIELHGLTTRTDRNMDGQTFPVPVQVFFEQKRPLPLPPKVPGPALLFTLAALRPDTAGYLERWQQGFVAFRDALDFYFSLDPIADTGVATEHHFLTAANAFEALHRVVGKHQLIRPEKEHEALLAEVLKPFAGKKRKWLKGKLQHSNEVSLEDRLREVYDSAPAQIREVLGDKTFASDIATTRNALIHHTEKLRERRPLKGVLDLWKAATKLRVIIQIEFLKQMGIEDALLIPVIERSWAFQRLRE